MKCKTWQELDGTWSWSIEDDYGDELASSDISWPTRELARADLHAAYEDWRTS